MFRLLAPVFGLCLLVAAGAMAAEADTPAGAEAAETAVFAGGCFWCVEEAFDGVDGVIDTTSGYAGGHVEQPTYEQVVTGDTGHAEVVRVRYDPARVDYETLLDTFWRNIDPFDGGGQFCDRGSSYRSVIFTTSEAQAAAAQASRAALAEQFGRPIATEIRPLEAFYPAEDYHQNYHQEHAVTYRFYKWNCGRSQRLHEIWGDREGS